MRDERSHAEFFSEGESLAIVVFRLPYLTVVPIAVMIFGSVQSGLPGNSSVTIELNSPSTQFRQICQLKSFGKNVSRES
jgi:hypothetical protein